MFENELDLVRTCSSEKWHLLLKDLV